MRPPKANSILLKYLATMAFASAPRLCMASGSQCFVARPVLLPSSLAFISSSRCASTSSHVAMICHSAPSKRCNCSSRVPRRSGWSQRPAKYSTTEPALFQSKPSDTGEEVYNGGISRLNTLQTLLSQRGAPGSRGCALGNGDLVPIASTSTCNDYQDLHPHLIPLAKSQSTGNVICALRRAYADDAEYDSPSLAAPWPIVESAVGLPGMRLLALNSEHLMRRIAADADANLDASEAEEIVGTYNEGLGSGSLAEKQLDTPYELGAVAALGYGLEKYVLLRVGPFPDLYETMSNQHLSRGDQESSLIAAEASNGKFGGFGSTFAFYAKLLASLPQREEESRDAARMCLRMPLPSMGLTREDFADVAKMAGFANSSDATEDALAKLLLMYEKIRDHEKEDNSGDKTVKQTAMEDANYLLDVACLTGQKYGQTRDKIADIYRKAGMEDMACFVECS